jgi:hypothetical protein
LANAQMFVSARLPVIFIDKCNVSGIETMIRDWSLQGITLIAHAVSGGTSGFFISRGLTAA